MLKAKKYGFFDFVKIPFMIAPIQCTLLLLKDLVSALIPSFRVYILASFIDTANSIFNGNAEEAEIYPAIVLYAATIAYNQISSVLGGFVSTKLGMKLTFAFKEQVMAKRAALEYKHVESEKTWDLITRATNDPGGQIHNGFVNVFNVVFMIVEAVSVISVLASFVWWAAIPSVIAAIPMYLISIKRGKKDYEENKESQKHTRRSWVFGALLTSRNNIEERAMFSYSKQLDEKWYELFEKARKIRKKLQILYFMKMRSSSLLTLFSTLIIAGLLLIPLSNGIITIGIYTSLIIAVTNLENIASWRLSSNIYFFANSREYLKDLSDFSILSETEGALDVPQNAVCDGRIEKIQFKNVTFKYPETELIILDDLSMNLYGDKHYSFVGRNGAGKTTITKLLTGLYTNYEGEIYVNDKNLREYTQAELKGLFSVVYQDFAKYEVTLRESVALGNVNNCTEEEIRKAVSIAGLEEETERFKDGLDTPLGKTRTDGTDVSGGQWQRIAIARTLVSPCPVHILDEPTAALDPISERSVYELFGRVSKGKMTIFITHRLGSARLADEILVLDGGKIIEQGCHDFLVKKGGLYAEMFDSQKSWYEVEVNV